MRLQPVIAVLLYAVASAASATSDMPVRDVVKGAQDHPLVSRFDGSKLVGYNVKQFEEVTLVTGKAYYKNSKLVLDASLKLEGKYTRIAYVYEKDRSSLEVFRNYEAALAKAGMKVLYSCAKEACGENLGSYFIHDYLGRDGFVEGGYRNPFNVGSREPRYLVAKGTQPDGTVVHVAVLVAAPMSSYLGGVSLQVVESKPMEAGKVTAALNAGDMARSIASEGRVAVYGVLFDTDRTNVKPESKDALAEMAKLLQQEPALKVHIVGHTDNQGSLANNLDLSQKRAESVVKVLVTDYKVDGKRLSAKGVGAYAPVASNDADNGREKNRRVELVKQ
jgi:OOP family OmpA-OmpF porin